MYFRIHALIDRTIDRAAHNDRGWRNDTILFSAADAAKGQALLTKLGFHTKPYLGRDIETGNDTDVLLDTTYVDYAGDS